MKDNWRLNLIVYSSRELLSKASSSHSGLISFHSGVRMLGFDGAGTDGRALFSWGLFRN